MKKDICDNCEDTHYLFTCSFCDDSDKCFCIDCLEEHISEHEEIVDYLIEMKKFDRI